MIDNELVADTLKKLNKAAIIHLNEGDYNKAMELFEQSKTIEEKLHLKVQQAESITNIANIYLLLKKYDEALESFKQALNIFKSEKKDDDVLKINQTLGIIYFKTKNYETAIHIFDECLKKSLKDIDKAYSYYYLALSFFKINNTLKSQTYFGNALTLFEKEENKEGIINCLYNRAKLFSVNRKDFAVQDLRKCLSLLDEKSDQNNELIKKIKEKVQELYK